MSSVIVPGAGLIDDLDLISVPVTSWSREFDPAEEPKLPDPSYITVPPSYSTVTITVVTLLP